MADNIPTFIVPFVFFVVNFYAVMYAVYPVAGDTEELGLGEKMAEGEHARRVAAPMLRALRT